MVTAHKSTTPAPPPRQVDPILHTNHTIQNWLTRYWQKLQLPPLELSKLAITQDRKEYMRWTGKRLNSMVLGCYCYLPAPLTGPHQDTRKGHHPSPLRDSLREQAQARKAVRAQALPFFENTPQLHAPSHRHLIFIEPDMQPKSIEVTVAHELIHLADRVNGTPRRHRHHGYDSIAADEAAITGYGVEELRHLLHEESLRREATRRKRRPIRYLYECPNCGKQYPRTRRYSKAVSCSSCDKTYNPHYRLLLRG
jgi:predicted SprT family Zn-dependent metalloprotease